MSKAFFWKAFHATAHDESFIHEEVKYIFREIYSWCLVRGRVKGNPPDFHNRYGKLAILGLAKHFFKTPKTLVTWGFTQPPHLRPAVAKSLTSGLTTTNQALFTKEVDSSRLHPGYPWFIQEKIESNYDVTVFVCGNRLLGFKRYRGDLKGLDWRAELDFTGEREEWLYRDLSESEKRGIWSLCHSLGVDWGRIDFMEDKHGELVFLEYNANGQWVFLDYHNKYGLLDAVVDYLTS